MSTEKKGVRLEHISKIYQDPKTHKDFYAVKDVSLDITPGSFVTLLGPSGCGKTTTLRMIAGFESPDEGEIYLGGEAINALTPNKRDTAMVFQSYALFPHYNVFDNVAYGLKLRKVPKEEIQRRVTDILALVELSGMESRMTNQLSGGQQQRVALARIMVNQPQLLMLDEPFSALDSHLRLRLQMEMKELLNSFGRDVLMVTHSRDEAYHICSEIAVMDMGSIKTVKETKALFADPESICAASLTGCKNIAKAEKVGDCEVNVPEWGIHLTTAQPVRDNVVAVGIRAHYFNTKAQQNRAPVVYVGEMEEPFEVSVRFRWANQRPDTEPLLWRVSKDKRGQSFPETFGVAPANILLLYS